MSGVLINSTIISFHIFFQLILVYQRFSNRKLNSNYFRISISTECAFTFKTLCLLIILFDKLLS